MQNQVTLTEAASYLGVSKATLRNWDHEGKLTALRNPVNGYRMYDLDKLIEFRKKIMGKQVLPDIGVPQQPYADSKTVKRVINKIHAIFRDTDANSNIMDRFDELSKLLFLKLYTEKENENIFGVLHDENYRAYAQRIRKRYAESIKKISNGLSSNYKKIFASDICIYKCGVELSHFSLGNSDFDIKGLAYEDMIRGAFDKSDNQQFFTPYQIVSFMVKMMKPYVKGNVCDPACGTAGFLINIAKNYSDVHLWGLEIDERLAWISKMNLLIHGASDFSVECISNGGTLGLDAKKHFNTYDAIVTNPPFGSDYSDPESLCQYELGKGRISRRRGVLFIERAWQLLKPNGVVAIIIDQGVLNSQTTVDVRRYILSHFEVLAVVELPESAFLPYADVSSSILFLKKVLSPVQSNRVFFAKSDTIGRKSNGDDDIIYSQQGVPALNSDLDTICALWEQFSNGNFGGQKANCYVADISSTLQNDDSFRMDYAYHHPYRNTSRQFLAQSKYPLKTIAELCEERNETYIPSADPYAASILLTGLANIEANNGVAYQVLTPAASVKSAVKRYEPNDIVFSRMRPNLRKVAVMNFKESGYVSAECVVLTVRKENGEFVIDPALLATLLRSDLVYGQILHYITGISRPRIGVTDLRKVKIPVVPREIQEQGKAALVGQMSLISQMRNKAKALMDEADAMELAAANNLAATMMGVSI